MQTTYRLFDIEANVPGIHTSVGYVTDSASKLQSRNFLAVVCDRNAVQRQCNRRYQTPPTVRCCPLVCQSEYMPQY